MRADERTPLSRAKLQAQILKDEKYAVISAVVPIAFVTLLAVGFTAAVIHFCAFSPLLLGILLLIGAVPFWVGDAVLLYRAGKAFKRYRRDLGRDFLTIETDTVTGLHGSVLRVLFCYVPKGSGRVCMEALIWKRL